MCPFDGLVLQFAAVVGNSYHELGGSITVDAPIWPRPFVVIANATASPHFPTSTGGAQDGDRRFHRRGPRCSTRRAHAEAVSVICQSGLLRFVETGPEGLEELRHAVEPVVEGIRSDARGAAILDRIQDLHRRRPRLPRPPAPSPQPTGRPRCPIASTAHTPPIPPRRTSARRASPRGDVVEGNWGHYVLVVQDGRYAITQENGAECTWVYGQWRMDDEWVRQMVGGGGGPSTHGTLNRPGEDFLFRWTEFDGTLHLTMPITDGPPDQPWTRVSTTPDLTAFPERCPPPPQAFSSD